MNRLDAETSPYLRQHAHNPVHWYPWGEDALQAARRERKPIFLSIGYSACHWCHVMERESFEDDTIAAFLNAHFVNIKVDREERPDLDAIYMDAVQLMTGQGGWPMTVFLTPELEPFFAGTYFPPRERYGRPGFLRVLQQLHDVWQNDPSKVERVTRQVTDRMREIAASSAASSALSSEPLDRLFVHLEGEFDARFAGFGAAPKFPPSMALRALLHVAACHDERRDSALDMVEQTLAHMASGGVYDHVGGGFHRYSVDERWLVPHFEKMLYDNALLMMAYTEAFQMTGRGFYERIVRETAVWLCREMTAPNGCFYSAQDADSEGEEGRFFVWTAQQIEQILGPQSAVAAEFWGITPGGNFEGKSIPNRLHIVESEWLDVFDSLPEDIKPLRDTLYAARVNRVAPATDTKFIAAWNGLMISALARAGAVFAEDDFIARASQAARFILTEMADGERGGLFRIYAQDSARFPGYLDDHAFVAAGCFDLFEATGAIEWLEHAERLIDHSITSFWRDDRDTFVFAAAHHKDLIVDRSERFDGATPAANSVATMTMLRLAVVLGREDLRDKADRLLRTQFAQMHQQPRSSCELVQALDFHLGPVEEVVCATPAGATSLARHAWTDFRPNAIIVDITDSEVARLDVARNRPPVDDRPTAYVCRDGVCELPVHEL